MNSNEYLRSLEQFLKKIEGVKDTMTDARLNDILSDICEVMRIGMVDVKFHETPNAVTKGKKNDIIFYDMGFSDPDDFVEYVAVTPDRNTAVYRAYIIAGATTWTIDERDKISLFLRLLFVFNGRSRLGYVVNRLTFYDLDLEICNIRYFMRHTGRLCSMRRIAGFAAIYFNLKRFSLINQQLGRERGTAVMKAFAHTLDDMLGEDELVGRIGGDNFIMLVRSDKLPKVIDALKGTGIAYGTTGKERVLVSAKAGVYVIPPGPTSPDQIMDCALLAVAAAKSGRTDDIVFYDETLLERKEKSMDIASSFPRALATEEFKVYYQPKVSVDSYEVVGAEALCRWIRDGKTVPPNEFIPILEQNMDICRLDFYMLEHVCMDICRWQKEGKRLIPISVNLSRRHLTDMDLLAHILEIVDKYDIPHDLIEIELTETTTDVEFKDLRRILTGLQEAGISTAVDDFGVGYSSLNLIKELPWDILKFDKSLLPASAEDFSSKGKNSMFRHVVEIAQEMGLECVAEGVETVEQLQVLRDAHCPVAQGFYFDKPLPLNEFEKRLDNYVYDQK